MPSLTRGMLPGLALLAVIASLAGCSALRQLLPERTPEYQNGKVVRPLEVPPGLSVPPADASMEIPGAGPTRPAAGVSGAAAGVAPGGPHTGAGQVAAPIRGIRVVRDGTERWLVIDAPPARIWPRVREFWLKNGFLIRKEDPRAGVLQTNWAEYRPNIAEGPIRMLLNKVISGLYSAPIRSQYLVRVEPGDRPGTTDLYLSLRSVREVVHDGNFIWEMNPPNPDREAAMLRRLMVFLGASEAHAKTSVQNAPQSPPRAELVRGAGGVLALKINDPFPRAWRRAGIALDRVGFLVQGQDRDKGLYYVRYDDPIKEQERRGLFARWFGSGKSRGDRYWIQLHRQPSGKDTRLVVLRDGGKPDRSKSAQRILTLLQEQLR
ncbi:lipoprotein [bacterium BMS3Bbin12]|nr:lipoprotein [bacterium BMS3Bbin12]GBE50030.1 lipoprotein [bacterium BMS3Bbin13]HDJ86416.1 outer membrane protein assembly factor BamC [Chromatiales bacterium]HDK02840.1 outer membrane protein assembly factor BamC [Gammaproteobacteria bacterium]